MNTPIKAIYYQLIFCVLFSINSIEAQEQAQITKDAPQIVVMSRPQKEGGIMLRWGVTTAIAWRKLNRYGYQIKRYTITKNKQTLPTPTEKVIGVFKPAPVESWIKITETNNNAAVMAQALYGERFDVEGVGSLEAIVNLSEEQEQRFTWAFYVADQDYTVAKKAGLAFIDTAISVNEKYVYKVTSLVPKEELVIEEGGVFTGLQDYEDLPKPLDLAVVFTENKAMLSWNYAIHKQTYNSYFVERSEDGSTFKRLNILPLTSLNNSTKTDVKRMFYIDTIVTNKKYYYRVLGKTPFSELSPISEVVSGKGEKVLKYVPRITTKKYLDDKRIILEWEFLEEGNKEISGFELNRSDKVDGIYKTVLKDIPATTRKIQYDNLQPTNYLTITAIGKKGGARTSLPSLVQPVDSVPPIKPIQFKGKVDSLGIVTLNWKANAEKDMLGYRVFRGNNKNEEYSQITIAPHQGTTYYDSISVKNLNAEIYYQLVAVDERFNMSVPSDILEIKKPDFIKPTQPVFKSYDIKEGKVHLKWANSASEDVIKHEVYRKENDSIKWQLVHTINTKKALAIPTDKDQFISKWTDENVIETKQYYYTIIAIDDSKLESDPAPLLTVIIPKTTLAPAVKRLGSYIDKQNKYIELFWKRYENPNAMKIAVYKGLKDKPISLLKNVLPNTKRIIDANVRPNNQYIYMLRVIFKDGSVSEIAILNVKF